MKKREILIIIFGAFVFAFILNQIFPENEINRNIVSPLTDRINGLTDSDEEQSEALGKIIEDSLHNTSGTYGIVVKNLRTGETYSKNADRKFQTASLYKLWVAATAFNQINQNIISRDQILAEDIEELNRIFDIDEEEAELTSGTITRTVDEAINEMITISANYPALLLSNQVKNSNIARYINELGLTDSSLGTPPTTTPSDMAIFYEKLYEGEIVNQTFSAEFIDILARQQLNDRIPKYLPANTRVAHKTGELYGFKHDAGIIFANDAILFVALSETDSQPTASENIANLSRDVFNYFNN